MSEKRVTLPEVLAYKDTYAPWFDLDEHTPFAILKRNLSMLQRMGILSGLVFDDLDRLSEKEIRGTIAAHNNPDLRTPKKTTQTPQTAAQFFHAAMSKSPYVSDIIPYSATKKQDSAMDGITLLTKAARETASTIHPKEEYIHGFRIKKDEAFSSTRYYSADQKIYGKIIAKDGLFTAHQLGLNEEQKIDLALEMSMQFLLNLPSDKKDVYINGSPQGAHQLHAAFLLLKRESGSRYSDITIHLPTGVHKTPDESDDAYIKKHLRSMKKMPEQVMQMKQFVDVKPVFQLNMDKILKTPGLSAHDKSVIGNYQTHLNEWLQEQPTPGTGVEILAAHNHRFIELTEAILPILKKTPDLAKEYEALKVLYEGELQADAAMLDKLYKNEVEYNRKKSEHLEQMQVMRKDIITDGITQIKECIGLIKSPPELRLTPKQHDVLKQHELLLKDMEQSIKATPNLSMAQIKEHSANLLKIAQFVEPVISPVTQKSEVILDLKATLKSISKPEVNRVNHYDMNRLKQEREYIDERFSRFKKKYRGAKNTAAPDSDAINLQTKEQIKSLANKAGEFISKNVEPEHKAIKTLIKLLKKCDDITSINKESFHELKKYIEEATPLLKEHAELTKTLSTLTDLSLPKVEEISKIVNDESAFKKAGMK